MSENNHKVYMREAIRMSLENVKNGGGPFAAVVVKDGNIIAAASNSVTNDNDPTAHAEVNAIRQASSKLHTFDLSDCVLYTSCEPCPMCLGAIYWAHIPHVFYGNTKNDAQNVGFDDSFIYDELAAPIQNRQINFTQILPDEAIVSFQEWDKLDERTDY